MADRRGGRVSAVVVGVLMIGAVAGGIAPPAGADVTAVRGEAFGYTSFIGLFGGPAGTRGVGQVTCTSPNTPVGCVPADQAAAAASPIVTLPATGGNQTQDDPDGFIARYGPANFFSAGSASVSTQGTLGAGGTVTSTATLNNINASGDEILTATSGSSTCMATENGVTASTTIINGVLTTGEDAGGNPITVAIPTNPPVGHSVSGVIPGVGDNFTYTFNEQTQASDGTITVYAGHMRAIGPTAVGDLYWGKSVCGVTATQTSTSSSSSIPGTSSTTPSSTTSTSTTSSTTTTRPPSTTTSTGPSTSTTTTTTPTVTDLAGGAYGYFVSISLFGGPANARGPAPNVELPSGGSATPVTASEPGALAQFGPATIFSSDLLEVSTEGTADTGVTSTATVQNVNKSGQEVFTASTVTSTCTASSSGATGSVEITGGRLVTSQGADLDSETDDVAVDIPANPSPGTSYNGTIENVGDNFRFVVNEQQQSGGSITVNAVHMYLLGPTAVGELIIGQSRCGLSTGGGGGGGGTGGGRTNGGGTGGGGTGGGSRALAFTGNEAVLFTLFALDLVLFGVMVLRWAARRRYGAAADDELITGPGPFWTRLQ